MSRRMNRVNVLLLQTISSVLASDVRDPRLSKLITVTRVNTTPDLESARVYVSVLGDLDAKKKSVKALKSASGFVRLKVREMLDLKKIPTLDFKLDDSLEAGSNLINLISSVNPSER